MKELEAWLAQAARIRHPCENKAVFDSLVMSHEIRFFYIVEAGGENEYSDSN